jgi:cytochrome c6
MKKSLVLSVAAFLALCIVFFGTLVLAAEKMEGKAGEALFKQHCEICHPDGGNIINPSLTLRSKELAAHGITKPEGIINKMRNPGPGMTKFDEKTIPDAEAKKIAEYILDTFK